MQRKPFISRIEPRGLSRLEAADYVGVGGTKFDEMVRDGRMPAGKHIDARVVWDRRKLDAAMDVLFDSESASADNPWAHVAV
jgi:hypothetical protein